MKHLIGSLLLSLCALAAAANATPITFGTTLDGLTESPANASLGTGLAQVVFDAATHMMEVKVTFSGLSAPTTASHIHCCTAVPNSGNVGVATETPTFSTFPLGVTSGMFDQTYDLTLMSSFNAPFVAANGGTAAGAEAALIAGLMDGTAYLNIHTAAFPAGEIRGFLHPLVVDNFPEPATLALLGAGLLGAFGARKRMKRS